MTNKRTGYSVITTNVGKMVTYAYSVIDDNGNITKSNVQASYVALDATELNIISQMEAIIDAKLNPTTTTSTN